jgi:hypothetical protein
MILLNDVLPLHTRELSFYLVLLYFSYFFSEKTNKDPIHFLFLKYIDRHLNLLYTKCDYNAFPSQDDTCME